MDVAKVSAAMWTRCTAIGVARDVSRGTACCTAHNASRGATCGPTPGAGRGKALSRGT